MPTRNLVKTYVADSYYHLYSRGVNKQLIFSDDEDKTVFLGILKRYLSSAQTKRKKHTAYRSFADDIELLAFCLMDNHFHLLIYQHSDPTALRDFMRRVMTTYSMYYNHRHERRGPLFQSNYLASRIDSDAYLQHISCYIHKNPSGWRAYRYSSLQYYLGEKHADWVKPARILEDFDRDTAKYLSFLEQGDDLDEFAVADQLAHT
jgi:REP element-mobilizing transposase RayT